MTGTARDASRWLWPAFFAVVLGVTAVRVAAFDEAGTERRWLALGLLAGLGGLYLAVGHRLVRRSSHGRAAWLYLVAVTAVVAGAAMLVPEASWAVAMAVPQAFMLLNIRYAIPVVLVMNCVPVLAVWVNTGFAADVLQHVVPQALLWTLLGVVIGLGMHWMAEQSNERGELIVELRASQEKVARFASEAGAAQERERLAGEIHDTLAQGFTSIVTLLQAAESRLATDPEAARRHLALATRTARENLAEARVLVAGGTPGALESATLVDAVRRQADRFVEETGVAVRFEAAGAARRLPATVEVIVLRAAQELLANVRRHAAASAVLVRLEYGPGSVTLRVHDDGAGFRSAAASDGLGLRGLRSRVERLGGFVRIASAPAEGTDVTVEVPA